MRYLVAFSCMVVLVTALPAASQESPYTGLQSREIKALSEDQVSGFLAGKGLGFALAAELNGYPGPKHVLELAEELALTESQHVEVTLLFDAMQASAAKLGEQIVAAEKALDTAFSASTITEESLQKMVVQIGLLTGELRAVHLAAHIETKALLTEKQTRLYVKGRGYHGSHHEGMQHGEHMGGR